MVAALLLSAGLILSCGGDDDDPVKKEDPKDTPATDVKYTVTFDTNGGTPATIDPITVDAGKTVGGAKWPDDPEKGGYVFDGWFDADDTEYKSSTKIEKDVTIKAKYSLRPVKDLGGFTTFGGQASQKGWANNGVDKGKDLTFEEIKSAKYIVLHTRGGAGTDWATKFALTKVIIQGGGNNWAWGDSNTTSIAAVTFARAANKDVFIVIDVSKLTGLSAFFGGTTGKFIIEYDGGGVGSNINIGLGLQAGYLSYQTLQKPATGAEDLIAGADVVAGFVTTENILGLTLPTTYYDVSFIVDGGTPTVDAVKVGSGKSLSVQYPTWVKKPKHTFEGWFNSTTEYTSSTPITADVALTAKWEEIPFPTFPGKDITLVEVNVGTNTIGIGTGSGYGNGAYDLDLFFDSKYLVLLFDGSNIDNGDGFGGSQVALQTDLGNGSKWLQTASGGWSGNSDFGYTPGNFAYMVIDLSKMVGYPEIVAAHEPDYVFDSSFWTPGSSPKTTLEGIKIVLNSGFSHYLGAWLTSESLDTTSWRDHGSGVFFLTTDLGF